MNAVPAKGPVPAPALAASRRRPIGAGARPVLLTHPARTAPRRLKPAMTSGKAMKRPTLYITSFLALLLTSVAAVGIGASVDSPRTLMSPTDYAAGKRAIESQSRLSLARCRGLAASEKEVCRAEVRADERIQKADLAARYHGTVAAGMEARQARVKAAYDVARVRCSAERGEVRMDCLHEARTARNRALAKGAAGTTT